MATVAPSATSYAITNVCPPNETWHKSAQKGSLRGAIEGRIYPITATETQLDFNGLYEPPLGPLGKAVNAIIGHRIAEASVHRFVSDVAGYLRKTLG